MVKVTDEAAQDFRALISGMSDDQVKNFLVHSVKAANAKSLTVTSETVMEDDCPKQVFILRFHQPVDTEYFLEPDSKV